MQHRASSQSPPGFVFQVNVASLYSVNYRKAAQRFVSVECSEKTILSCLPGALEQSLIACVHETRPDTEAIKAAVRATRKSPTLTCGVPLICEWRDPANGEAHTIDPFATNRIPRPTQVGFRTVTFH